MTGNFWKYGYLCGCLLLAASMAAMAAYRLSLASRQQVLQLQIFKLEGGIAGLEREYKENSRVVLGATGLWNASKAQDEALKEMLRECNTREDFVVREGPRIGWSELSGSTDGSTRIGIYIPAGRHWLKYAIGNSDTEEYGGVGYQRFHHGDPRDIEGVVSVELAGASEVYEFRLNISDRKSPKIEVLGRGNVPIHEDELPVKVRGTIFKKASNDVFAFPSEFKPNQDQRPYFLKPALPPITELGIVSGAGIIRLWIESDARPCMPAIYVAANYAKVTSLRYRHDNPARIERVTDPDTEFNRLFEPYDGAGRLYFRETIFTKWEGE